MNDVFAKVKKHNDEKVRLSAYQALALRFGKKGPVALPAKLVLPHLIDAAKDASASIRVLGVQGLGALGADAKDALPVVMGLLNDPDQRVRARPSWRSTRSRSDRRAKVGRVDVRDVCEQ